MRSAWSLLVAGILWCGAVPPAMAQSSSIDDHARFTADVEQARAHLLISQELYATGQASRAALHSSHPVQELGNRIIGPIKAADGELAARMRAALKKPGDAVDRKVSRAQYEALVREVDAALDDAVDRVVPKAVRTSVGFQAQVIERLLAAMVEEYEEAFRSGRIAQVVEYQDAYGFFRRAQALYRGIARGTGNPAAADFAALSKGFPGVSPPRSPLPPDRVKALAARISTALRDRAAR